MASSAGEAVVSADTGYLRRGVTAVSWTNRCIALGGPANMVLPISPVDPSMSMVHGLQFHPAYIQSFERDAPLHTLITALLAN